MKFKSCKLITASILATIILGCSSTSETNTNIETRQIVSYEDQKQVEELVQTGIYYYWHGGDLKKVEDEFFKGITLKGKYDVVENSFKEASTLAPNRLDLRFAVASTQIIQKNIDGALATYKGILDLDPTNFEASILHAIFSKVNGDEATYNLDIENLNSIHPEQTKEYLDSFARTNEFLDTKLSTTAEKINSDNHAIVVLGYALSDKGSMREPLIGRLEQALAVSKKNPDSPIIVSGGVPKEGVTEAYLMKKWLIEKGVDEKLIYIDDKAKDTVGNGHYSSIILKELNSTDVTLITSASHIRRGLSIFKEATLKEGLDVNFTNNVYLDYDSLEDAQIVSSTEELVVYRDLMRVSGLWAYPGIQQ